MRIRGSPQQGHDLNVARQDPPIAVFCYRSGGGVPSVDAASLTGTTRSPRSLAASFATFGLDPNGRGASPLHWRPRRRSSAVIASRRARARAVIIAQTIGADAPAHRALGLRVPQSRNRHLVATGDVVVSGGDRGFVAIRRSALGVSITHAPRQPMQRPRRRRVLAAAVGAVPRLYPNGSPSSALVSVDLPAPDEPSTTSVRPRPR